jgi:hypothetical protein
MSRKWGQYVHPYLWYISTNRHGLTIQKIVILRIILGLSETFLSIEAEYCSENLYLCTKLVGVISLNIGYFSWLSSVPSEKCWNGASIRPRPLLSESFPVHHPFDGITDSVVKQPAQRETNLELGLLLFCWQKLQEFLSRLRITGFLDIVRRLVFKKLGLWKFKVTTCIGNTSNRPIWDA